MICHSTRACIRVCYDALHWPSPDVETFLPVTPTDREMTYGKPQYLVSPHYKNKKVCPYFSNALRTDNK